MAASNEKNFPPSLKLSGVTFSTPMTSVRSPYTSERRGSFQDRIDIRRKVSRSAEKSKTEYRETKQPCKDKMPPEVRPAIFCTEMALHTGRSSQLFLTLRQM